MAEDAPTDIIHIPAQVENKKDARKFLTFMARADVQEKINASLLQIPANTKAKPVDEHFLNEGNKMLSATTDLAQFYDRDTDPEANAGMRAFQEFMDKPQNLKSNS